MKMKLAILLVVVISLGFVNVQEKPLYIIVNSNNTVEEMTVGAVKITYLRKIRKRWKSIPKNVKPVDYSDLSIKQEFYQKVLKMDETDVKRYFVERQYQRAEAPPQIVSTEGAMIEFVRSNQGAIGYISSIAKLPNGVKVICKVE